MWLAFYSLAFAAPATKESPKGNDVPKDSAGSIVIPIQSMAEDLQMLEARKYGIVVRYILPKGWKVEEAKDAETRKLRDDMHVYIVTSARPMPDPGDKTDFVFELDMYEQTISEALPKDSNSKDLQAAYMKAFLAFLDEQLSMNLKQGYKLLNNVKDIQPKEYGPDSRGKYTYFWPIYYELPPPPKNKEGLKGAHLYTFTSYEGDRIYMLKFLVSKDMVEQHAGLIAFMLDNCWAVTEEVDKKMVEYAKQQAAEGGKSAKAKGKNN
jgi:hypothetical protein